MAKRLIICKCCGKEGEHQAKGLIKRCYLQKWYRENKEQHLELGRRWRKRNPEGQRIINKRYRDNNKDEARAYRQENRDRISEYLRGWREENREKMKEYFRQYYLEHRAEKLAYARLRKVRKAKVPNTLTQEQIDFETNVAQAIWPDEELHLHHVVPISKGGGHTWGNIMVIPASLNLSIGDKLPQEVYKQEALWG